MVKLKGMQWAKTKQSGFTIVELLIVIVVIAILAAITIVSYNGVRQRAAESVAKSAASQAVRQIMNYATLNSGAYPEEDDLTAIDINDTATTRYLYSVDNATTPPTFCLSVLVNGVVFYQSSAQSNPVSGVCAGHVFEDVTVTPEPEPEPLVCETNFIKVPGNSAFGTSDFCVMKYEAKNVGGKATSQVAQAPWVSMTQTAATTRAAAACDGCQLITEAQWLTIAHNLASVPSNWSGGAVGTGYIYNGHYDNAPTGPQAASTNDNPAGGYTYTNSTSGPSRRTLKLSTGDTIWDFAGNVSEFTSALPTGGQPGLAGAGFGTREWNALNVTGTMSPNPFPSYGTPAAANWTSAQGIGQAYTSATDTEQRVVVRGGAYNSGVLMSGIFAVSISSYPTGSSNPAYGLRATHQ